jgi:hypothetical protein
MPRRLLIANALLALVGIGAGAYIVSEVRTPPPATPLRPRAAVEPASPPAPPVTPVGAPAGTYGVIAARNLFSPNRSEAAAAATPARTGLMLPKPTLHGVVMREGTQIAYLEDPSTKRVAGYRVGDSVAGGTLKTITSDHVVLMRPEGAVDVRLRDPGKPRPAAPVTATPQQPIPGTPQLPGAMQPPPQPGIVTPGVPGVESPPSVPPAQVPIPPRRMLPPNVLRRVPPTATDATP